MRRRTLIKLLTLPFTAVVVAYFWFIYAPTPSSPGYALEHMKLEVGGRNRRYELYAPQTANRQAPLLLVFHGSMGDAATIRRRTGYRFEAIAEREGFLVAYPAGVGGYWNGCRKAATHIANVEDVDDVGFVRQLIDGLAESGRIDKARVYASGYSNGGHMAYRLAMETPDLVAGIAPFAANLPADDNLDCNPVGVPVRTVIVNGTEDPVNPFAGGEMSFFGFRTLGDVRSSADSAEYFRALHGTGSAKSATISGGDRVHARIDELRHHGRAVVSLVTIRHGGHTIPQTLHRFPRILGPTFENDEIIEYVWEFLSSDDLYHEQR